MLTIYKHRNQLLIKFHWHRQQHQAAVINLQHRPQQPHNNNNHSKSTATMYFKQQHQNTTNNNNNNLIIIQPIILMHHNNSYNIIKRPHHPPPPPHQVDMRREQVSRSRHGPVCSNCLLPSFFSLRKHSQRHDEASLCGASSNTAT